VDCIEGMALMERESVDLIFCDLPYGITASNKWDSAIDKKPLWQSYERIIKPNGAIILFGQDKFTIEMIHSNMKLFRYCLIWQKTHPVGFLNAKRRPLKAHEDIMVFYKKQPTYNPQKTTGHERKVSAAGHKRNCHLGTNYKDYKPHSYDSTERYPTSVLTFKSDIQKNYYHPTQKPLELCRYIIRSYSNPGDLVLDNCCGSGTIPLAAKMEGRNYIGMDNGVCDNPKSIFHGVAWADIAAARIRDEIGVDENCNMSR
jgi:DNA modification methylase